MPRPKKPRFVANYPIPAAFVPQGVPVSGDVFLTVEELEAIRLSDFEGLDQETGAELMAVSRQTYGRVLAKARRTVGQAVRNCNGGHVAFAAYPPPAPPVPTSPASTAPTATVRGWAAG